MGEDAWVNSFVVKTQVDSVQQLKAIQLALNLQRSVEGLAQVDIFEDFEVEPTKDDSYAFTFAQNNPVRYPTDEDLADFISQIIAPGYYVAITADCDGVQYGFFVSENKVETIIYEPRINNSRIEDYARRRGLKAKGVS